MTKTVQSEKQREQAEAMFLLDSMRTAIHDVPSFASRYDVLATAERDGLITEYEYQLLEDGKTV